jgi:hypothetical protein
MYMHYAVYAQGVSGGIFHAFGRHLLGNLHQCNKKQQYSKLNSYGDNGERSFKD